jgi:AcrR family transcriptional regulator
MTVLTIVVILGGNDMPRALTEQEKCSHCSRLLSNGKAVVLSQGIRKVSVDEIAKAAGIAKGSFYQHFESKEKYLYALIEFIHREVYAKAEQMIISGFSDGKDPRANARVFLEALFYMPEMAFFIKNERDIDELFFCIMPDNEMRLFKQMEVKIFEKLLKLAGADAGKVKPGVVNNYFLTLYLMMGCDLMTVDDLPETVDLITDSLIFYIFGGS